MYIRVAISCTYAVGVQGVAALLAVVERTDRSAFNPTHIMLQKTRSARAQKQGTKAEHGTPTAVHAAHVLSALRREVCAVHKADGVGLTAAQVMRLVRVACTKCEDVIAELKAALQEHEVARVQVGTAVSFGGFCSRFLWVCRFLAVSCESVFARSGVGSGTRRNG